MYLIFNRGIDFREPSKQGPVKFSLKTHEGEQMLGESPFSRHSVPLVTLSLWSGGCLAQLSFSGQSFWSCPPREVQETVRALPLLFSFPLDLGPAETSLVLSPEVIVGWRGWKLLLWLRERETGSMVLKCCLSLCRAQLRKHWVC